MEGFALISFLFLFASWTEAVPYDPIGTYIVGGRPALQGEVPYQLSLQYSNSSRHICGAVLVRVNGTQIGLTAAHCITNNTSYEVIAGDLNRLDKSGIEQKLSVESVLVHPKYSDRTLQNDIAILFLNGSFQLNENVTHAPLPKQGQELYRGNLTVSGWGSLFPGGLSTVDLQIVEIPVVNYAECKKAYKDYIVSVTESMVCAGGPVGGISPCHGDSGGPAVSPRGHLTGLVSWVYNGDCGHPKYPAVFTKVSHYIHWIRTNVRKYITSN